MLSLLCICYVAIERLNVNIMTFTIPLQEEKQLCMCIILFEIMYFGWDGNPVGKKEYWINTDEVTNICSRRWEAYHKVIWLISQWYPCVIQYNVQNTMATRYLKCLKTAWPKGGSSQSMWRQHVNTYTCIYAWTRSSDVLLCINCCTGTLGWDRGSTSTSTGSEETGGLFIYYYKVPRQ